MATLVKLTSGLLAQRLTVNEQNKVWSEIMVDTNPIGKHCLFTPQDNLTYFIVSEKELSWDKFEATIKANGQTIILKYNICNQDDKINKAVRKAYGK